MKQSKSSLKILVIVPDDVFSWRLFGRRTFRPDFGIWPLSLSAVISPTDLNLRNSSPTDRMTLHHEPDRRERRVSKEEAKDIILPKMSL